jgi:hypothetical protein
VAADQVAEALKSGYGLLTPEFSVHRIRLAVY